MIRWEGVLVAYGSETTLGPMDLRVEKGEWIGMIGPNGAGKSTMLRAGIGLVDHSGVFTINGGTHRPGLDIAWVPQRPEMPPSMGVSDYVMLGRTPHLGYVGAESRHDVAAVRLALDKLDLIDLRRRTLSTLSGGEAQRVVLARAIAQEAPVLFLDEPTASLDAGQAVEVLELIDELRTQEALTVVMAAHDLTLAARYCDRLVLVERGRVAVSGPAENVLTEPVLRHHYGSGIRVISDVDGPVVVPTRARS